MNISTNLRLCSKFIVLLIAFFSFSTAAYAAPPTITILGANPLIHDVNSPYTDAGATAIDENGNNITSLITITSAPVNAYTVGNQSVVYSVTDANGKTTITTRIVNVVDREKPVVVASPVNICLFDLFDPLKGVSAMDNFYPPIDFSSGQNMCKINILSSTVNTAIPGIYTVCYQAVDGSGNISELFCRMVNVINCSTAKISELPKELVAIYPNPCAGKFEIELIKPLAENAEIKITNLNGQIIHAVPPATFINNKATLDLTGTEAGIYFVQVNNNQKLSVVKLVVNK